MTVSHMDTDVAVDSTFPKKIRIKYSFCQEIRVLTVQTNVDFDQIVEKLRHLTGGHDKGRLIITYHDGEDAIAIHNHTDWVECYTFILQVFV